MRHKNTLRVYLTYLAISLMTFLPIGSPAHAETALMQSAAPLVIHNDWGGSIGRRNEKIRRLKASGTRVELQGICYSSCTMYLGLPNVCVGRASRFGFHGPHGIFTKLPQDAFDYWSYVMAKNYREPLRSWFMDEARYRKHGLAIIKGEELIRLGYPDCATDHDHPHKKKQSAG